MENKSIIDLGKVPRKGVSKKILAAILAIVIVSATLVVTFASSSFINEDITWTGVVIPSKYVTGSTSGCYFVGVPSNQPNGAPQTFELNTDTEFSAIVGGEFNIYTEEGQHILNKIINTDVDGLTSSELANKVSESYLNVQATITSFSVVYDSYTYGVGTDGVKDYIWVAPLQSYPTLFNQVQITGTVMDEASLDSLATKYPSSIFNEIRLDAVVQIANVLGYDFNGDDSTFVTVTGLQYLDTYSVKGDILDTITPQDLNRLADCFKIGGTDWIKKIVGNWGEGCAIMAQADTTIQDTTLWFTLYPLSLGSNFNGLCEAYIAKSDLSILLNKIVSLNESSLKFSLIDFDFELCFGVMYDYTPGTYTQKDVVGAWDFVRTSHPYTMAGSASVTGYSVVVDAQSMLASLSSVFGVGGASSALDTLTTFRNPAFVLMLDEDFPEMFNLKRPAWEYGLVAIVPNYVHQSSAMRYMEMSGTLYDVARYLGSTSYEYNIPLMVVDSYDEITSGLQQTTLKEICQGDLSFGTTGGHRSAYVEFDAETSGIGLKTVGSLLGAGAIVNLLPLDVGAYWTRQWESWTLYHLPVVYMAAGNAPNFVSNTVSIRGLYVELATDMSIANGTIDGILDFLTNSGVFPKGILLAFEITEMSTSTSIKGEATAPYNAYTSEFELTYSCSGDIDTVQLYWSPGAGILRDRTWYYYGSDPTPGDGLFTVNTTELRGDGKYEWVVRVKNSNAQCDQPIPSTFTSPELITEVNGLPPEPVTLYLPYNPKVDGLTIQWTESADPNFACYKVYCSTNAQFSAGLATLVKQIDSVGSTELPIGGMADETQYYFIVRVCDTAGYFSDSNKVYSRTMSPIDSPYSTTGIVFLSSGNAWSEACGGIWDGDVDVFGIELQTGDTLNVQMIGYSFPLLGAATDLLIGGPAPDYILIESSRQVGCSEFTSVTVNESGFYYIIVTSE